MKCFLIFTIVSLTNNLETNTQPRTWTLDTFNSEEACISDGSARQTKDFNTWILSDDEQGQKQAKTECVCFKN